MYISLRELAIPLLLTLPSVIAAPVFHPFSSRFDWLSKIFPGEGTAKQGDDISGGWLWGWGWTWSESTIYLTVNSSITFTSKPAQFGLRIVNAPGLAGNLIPTNTVATPCKPRHERHTNHGCPSLCTESPIAANDSWIALVERGECSFVNKVREAQRLGAIAVVVGGTGEAGESPDLITMYSPGDASDIMIPSCYVTHETYVDLAERISHSNHTVLGQKSLGILLGEDEAWQWPVFTFSLLLLLPSLLTLLTLVVHRIRQQRAEIRERAPEDIVNNLPTRVWNGTGWEKDEHAGFSGPDRNSGEHLAESAEEAVDTREEGGAEPTHERRSSPPRGSSSELEPPSYGGWFATQVECAICLSAFERGDRVRVLPCGHVFHIDEVDAWLIRQKKLCPICKTDVTAPPSSSPPTQSPLRAFPRAVAMSSTSSTSNTLSPPAPNEQTPLLAVPPRTP